MRNIMNHIEQVWMYLYKNHVQIIVEYEYISSVLKSVHVIK